MRRGSAGAAARLCSTLQSLQSSKGSAGAISRQLPLPERSPRRRELSPRGACSLGARQKRRGRRQRIQLCPRTSRAGQAALGRACPRADAVKAGTGTASAMPPTTPRRGSSSGAAISQPGQIECPRLHTQPLEINQCCCGRQGGVCPRRRFSSSAFQARGFVPAPPAHSIFQTSAFAQRQLLQLLRAAPACLLPARGYSLGRGCPAPSETLLAEMQAACWLEQLCLCSQDHIVGRSAALGLSPSTDPGEAAQGC